MRELPWLDRVRHGWILSSGSVVGGQVREHVAVKSGDFIDDELVAHGGIGSRTQVLWYRKHNRDEWVHEGVRQGRAVFWKEIGGVVWQVSVKWLDCRVIGDD